MNADPADPILAGRCHGCRMPPAACFCAEIPTIPTRTRIIVVRHCREIWRTSNTGRLVARALPNCTLVDHGLRGAPSDLGDLGADAWLLFPGGAPPREVPDVGTLVVLDGTWAQVRSMRYRIPPLPRLRVLSLPPPVEAPLRVRASPNPDALATIEAVADALELLEGPEPAARLRAVFDAMARRMRGMGRG